MQKRYERTGNRISVIAVEDAETVRIAQLENESAMLALELVDTQIRLDQAEAEQAALLLELVDKGVL
ncbi:hypothetical protein [Cohnella sp.]|uniref:hypothetical protein n=1 Tax=Cohnella sp. TaxID=1883426 RepID=UPI0037048F0A